MSSTFCAVRAGSPVMSGFITSAAMPAVFALPASRDLSVSVVASHD